MAAIVVLYCHLCYLSFGESTLRDARLFSRQSLAFEAVRADGHLPVLHDGLSKFDTRLTTSKTVHSYTPARHLLIYPL